METNKGNIVRATAIYFILLLLSTQHREDAETCNASKAISPRWTKVPASSIQQYKKKANGKECEIFRNNRREFITYLKLTNARLWLKIIPSFCRTLQMSFLGVTAIDLKIYESSTLIHIKFFNSFSKTIPNTSNIVGD